jgi:hypothetical protein
MTLRFAVAKVPGSYRDPPGKSPGQYVKVWDGDLIEPILVHRSHKQLKLRAVDFPLACYPLSLPYHRSQGRKSHFRAMLLSKVA